MSTQKESTERRKKGISTVLVALLIIALLLIGFVLWRQLNTGQGEEAPQLAYDASHPKVIEILTQIPLVVHHPDRYTCASHAGLNNLLPEVVEGNVIGPHSGDIVFRGDNVLFKYQNGSFQLIYENPAARFENGEASLPFEQAMQFFANGQIVWSGSFGDWPGRGVTGCDLSAQP